MIVHPLLLDQSEIATENLCWEGTQHLLFGQQVLTSYYLLLHFCLSLLVSVLLPHIFLYLVQTFFSWEMKWKKMYLEHRHRWQWVIALLPYSIDNRQHECCSCSTQRYAWICLGAQSRHTNTDIAFLLEIGFQISQSLSLLFTRVFLNSQSSWHAVTVISKYWNQKANFWTDSSISTSSVGKGPKLDMHVQDEIWC